MRPLVKCCWSVAPRGRTRESPGDTEHEREGGIADRGDVPLPEHCPGVHAGRIQRAGPPGHHDAEQATNRDALHKPTTFSLTASHRPPGPSLGPGEAERAGLELPGSQRRSPERANQAAVSCARSGVSDCSRCGRNKVRAVTRARTLDTAFSVIGPGADG